MKTMRYLTIVLLSSLIVACSNDEERAPGSNTGTKKTVTLNLSGIAPAPISTKAVATKSSASVINLNDITILLTDGTNIYVKKTFASTSPEYASVVGVDGYIFHEVDPAINKVIVLGNTSGSSISYASVAAMKSSVMSVADEQNKNDVLLYGENTLTSTSTPPTTPHPNTDTDYFTTTVNLSALVARLEIGKIQCDDLGTMYSSFKLAGIGLVDIYQSVHIDGTDLSPKLSIYTGPLSFGLIYMPGLATPPVGGLEFGSAPSLAWAYDAISPLAPFTSSSTVYYAGGTGDNTKVFAYNFIPVIGGFPNVKLRLSDVVTADNNPTNFSYVSTKNYTGADTSHPKAGYIYQFDLVFKEINIGPFDPDARICVGVNVTVSSWVIQALTPVFY